MESIDALKKQRDAMNERIAELEQRERSNALEQIVKLMGAAGLAPEAVVALNWPTLLGQDVPSPLT